MGSESRPHEHVLLIRHAMGEAGVAAPFAEIVWDRPEKRNALTPGMVRAFVDAVESLTENAGDVDGPGAIVVRGEGALFCAGFDLPLCRDEPGTLEALLEGLSEAVSAMRGCGLPVVLCAQGAALAGGCALLGGADIVVADRRCKLGYPVANLGISPAVSAPSLRTRMGPGGGASRARLLDPGLVEAGDAQAVSLVNVLVEIPEDVTPRGQLIAMKLAGLPRGAMASAKRSMNRADGSGDEAARLAGLEASLGLARDGAHTERLERFLSKRR
jgi:enoyl-CoA hydratase/carnithine racemase